MSELKFAPFSSAIDTGFWYRLTQKKLDVFRLDDAPVNIRGFYSLGTSKGIPPVFHVDHSSLDDCDAPSGNVGVQGMLLNTNTLEEFKNKDKMNLLQSVAQQIWEGIKDGSALKDPSLLQRFLCLTFADLKKYHYYYWMAFPALSFPKGLICDQIQGLSQVFTAQQLDMLNQCWRTLEPKDLGAFLVHVEKGSCSLHPLSSRDTLQGQVFLGCADPSSYAQHPGWPLRNLIALVVRQWGGKSWEVVCLRRKAEDGVLVTLHVEEAKLTADCPDCVGWEMHKGKLAPRKVDMSETMDPHRLADNAVDLNLRLMRWRLAPSLQLERLRGTRCLLFGAGTLGCNVARCLMGWGVRCITLVDNGRVSYSNPVRQSLYTFDDCQNGGAYKATAAAQHLRHIFPGVEATGKVMSIPMPGHFVPENMHEEVVHDAGEIDAMVQAHDVLFLLTDTRESRWLPSLLAAQHNKLAMNAALGFDTFLVMRHGVREKEGQSGPHLGCYFCNDVVAPGNSTLERTLDQQCTVTRPGLAYIAAAVVVELMVSILQHPLGGLAPATVEGDLGLVPHQIRGYLHNFQNTLLTSQAFDKCTACSNRVLKHHQDKGAEFLLQVMADPCHLEQVAGLTELCSGLSHDEIIALSDDDDSA